VNWLEWQMSLVGPTRMKKLAALYFSRFRAPFNLPGFARLGVY
jgi:hypothetical protein